MWHVLPNLDWLMCFLISTLGSFCKYLCFSAMQPNCWSLVNTHVLLILIYIWFGRLLLVLTICSYASFIFQEKKRNNLKDFLNVAGPMGVTHFLILSKTAAAPYLRVATTPQGPTLTFKINDYSLAADIARSQLHPRCPKDLFKNSALVNYFSYSRATEAHGFIKFR